MLGERLFRQREHDRDGAKLGDDHQAVRVVGVNDVALVHLPDAGAPINGRTNRGVIELDLGAVDGRLVGFHRRFELADQRLLRVVDLLRDDFCGQQVGVPFQVHAGVGELRFVLRLSSLRPAPAAFGNGAGSICASTSPV